MAGRGPGAAGGGGRDARNRSGSWDAEAAGTERRALRRRQGFGRFEGLVGRLPGGAFGVGQERGLVEEGPDAVELGRGRRDAASRSDGRDGSRRAGRAGGSGGPTRKVPGRGAAARPVVLSR